MNSESSNRPKTPVTMYQEVTKPGLKQEIGNQLDSAATVELV